MGDPFKSIITLGNAKQAAAFADAAAKMMAEHCDRRIDKITSALHVEEEKLQQAFGRACGGTLSTKVTQSFARLRNALQPPKRRKKVGR